MTKKTLWMLTGTVALSAIVAGCGTQKSVALPNHTKTVHHHKQAVPRTSVSSTAPTSPSPVATTPPAIPMATYNYPTTVAAGAPAVAQPFDFQFTATTGKTPPPPTGGLAGPNGQAAAWAIGQRGAIVLFINPTNPWDPWSLRYEWVPVAEKYHIALDVVDTQSALTLATVGPAPTSPSEPIQAIQTGQGGQTTSFQSLSQMAATMASAAKQWGLPSWVHLYEISPQTTAAWHINLPLDPTLWIFAPPLVGYSSVPTMDENLDGATLIPTQVMSQTAQMLGNLP